MCTTSYQKIRGLQHGVSEQFRAPRVNMCHVLHCMTGKRIAIILHMRDATLSWDAYEYHFVDRTADWFWSLGIIAVSIAILAILFGNALFGIFVLVASIAIGLYAARPPALSHITLTNHGVEIDGKLHHYSELHSFHIDEFHHQHPRLVFLSKKIFNPHLVILIDHNSAHDISDYLSHYLPAEPHKDSLFHTLFEKIGF
jgi:hypothetical protein